MAKKSGAVAVGVKISYDNMSYQDAVKAATGSK